MSSFKDKINMAAVPEHIAIITVLLVNKDPNVPFSVMPNILQIDFIIDGPTVAPAAAPIKDPKSPSSIISSNDSSSS